MPGAQIQRAFGIVERSAAHPLPANPYSVAPAGQLAGDVAFRHTAWACPSGPFVGTPVNVCHVGFDEYVLRCTPACAGTTPTTSPAARTATAKVRFMPLTPPLRRNAAFCQAAATVSAPSRPVARSLGPCAGRGASLRLCDVDCKLE